MVSNWSHDVAFSTFSPRRTRVPEPLWVNNSLARSAGRVIDTEDSSGSLSSRSSICSIYLHAVDPRLLHQLLVLGGEVDRVDQLAFLVEQAAGAGQEDDLVRLQLLHQRRWRRSLH